MIAVADIAVIAVWTLFAVSSASAGPSRPNLLFIVAEDLSPRIGAFGDAVARTPRIDQLAREGVRYTRAFTTAGVCAPSRAAMIMGAHQNSWGAGHMRASGGGYVAVPPPEWKAFPELLRAAGYYTVTNGKTDYQMSTELGGATGGPFTIWDEDSGEDWRGRDPAQPFFAYLTLDTTHESQVWPTWKLNSLMAILLAPMRIANHLSWVHETDPGRVRLPAYYPDTPTVRSDLARHYNNIALMDQELGAILDELEAAGLAETTIVVFMTDHGDGLPRAKRWLYDSGIHVPMIVRWPDRRGAGSVEEELVSGVDLAPTFLALAGAARPPHLQGRVFLGPDREPSPEYVFAARDRIDEQPDAVRAARDRRWKYIRNLRPELPYVLDVSFRDQMPMMAEMRALAAAGALDPGPSRWFASSRDPEELYDTSVDPEEMNNLALDPKHLKTKNRLSDALDRWLSSFEDLGLIPEDALRERVWPDGEQPQTESPTIRIDVSGRITLHSESEGASIAYRIDDRRWRLYARPFEAVPGSRITARAVRYGWQPSREEEATLP